MTRYDPYSIKSHRFFSYNTFFDIACAFLSSVTKIKASQMMLKENMSFKVFYAVEPFLITYSESK